MIYALGHIAELLNGELKGDATCQISRFSSLESAGEGDITFIYSRKLVKKLSNTSASAVIVPKNLLDDCPVHAIVVADPQRAHAKVAGLFVKSLSTKEGIHPTAVIAEGCEIHDTAVIGPECVIEQGARLGAHTQIGAGCVIGQDSVIGEACVLHPRVTVYHDVKMGDRVKIDSGAVIGADGFGFINNEGRWERIPQLGGVSIGDDVEIGACTTIDRGAVDDTVIEEGVKLDNHIQVAHNVRIGAHTIIAAHTGIAGSTVIGKHCMMGGGCRINDHIEIADGVMLAATAVVPHSIKKPGVYSSGVPLLPHMDMIRNAVRYKQLDEMLKRIKKLESGDE